MLYILCVEVLPCKIRSTSSIKGFLLPGCGGKQFKVSQYADDTTPFVKNEKSLNSLLNVITSNSLNSSLAFNRVLEDVDNLHNTSEQTLNIQIDTLRDIDEEVFLDTSQDPARLAGVTRRISRRYNC